MSQEDDVIVLYDIPAHFRDSNKTVCFSPNVWKIRAALNYKEIPYKTRWVEMPDLAPTLSSFGIPPNEKSISNTAYTVPTVRFPDGEYIMESRAIAKALDERYSERKLHMEPGSKGSEYAERVQNITNKIGFSLISQVIYRIPDWLLNPPSAEMYHAARTKSFGMTLYEARDSTTWEECWEKAEPGMQELKDLLNEDVDGPFVMGKEVSFADFVLGGFWRGCLMMDEDGDLYGKIMGFDESFGRHWEGVKRYFERDDY